ncbi:gliding motility protein RemB [Pedobacter sp. HMF7647]|uniref:Gliding motility protein RemB n=1 Tax=Hufsiella arboris TaxID=2695275 RepID=A0A7K1YBI7_9SPHI|nr:capsule assembly Wzi family protein [Hufsiella arboris]MXV51731.1 gliding motility protein RemB [Hufsiella arboris]
MIKTYTLLCLCLLIFVTVNAQTPNQYYPNSFKFYQKLDNTLYNSGTRLHTSMRPFFIDDSVLARPVDSLLNNGVDTSRKTWVSRKLFNEHLLQVNNADYTVYADFLPDFMIGKDFTGKKTTWLNTRGFQAGGSIGKKFSFYTSGYENQASAPDYYRDYASSIEVVPGQSRYRKPYEENLDWSYVTALISYTPIKYLNITVGQDKNFIGDGYRSMILSDFASNYPFLKLTAKLGNVQYTAMWAAMQDPGAPQVSYDAGNRRKGGVFHYLDWNVSKRLSLGFFDAVVWAQTDSLGNKRGFDWSYANPIIFLRPLEDMSGSPDNAAIGFTAKYKVLNKTALYGQFFLDEFVASDFFKKDGDFKNKWGLQLGLRGADLFNVTNLNYLAEFNTAKPYTYSERNRVLNYAHYNEPLAHPYGANFRETVGILSYSYKRFDVSAQFNYAKYGLDTDSLNYGKDIFKPYGTAVNKKGNFIGQGLTTNFYYGDIRTSFLINPKYNLRFELSFTTRTEKNAMENSKANFISFGLRSSFRNLYQDF